MSLVNRYRCTICKFTDSSIDLRSWIDYPDGKLCPECGSLYSEEIISGPDFDQVEVHKPDLDGIDPSDLM